MTIHANKPDLKPDERAAAVVGGNDGGAYLESIGKFDLRTLSEAEWGEFCARIFAGAVGELRRVANDQIPF